MGNKKWAGSQSFSSFPSRDYRWVMRKFCLLYICTVLCVIVLCYSTVHMYSMYVEPSQRARVRGFEAFVSQNCLLRLSWRLCFMYVCTAQLGMSSRSRILVSLAASHRPSLPPVTITCHLLEFTVRCTFRTFGEISWRGCDPAGGHGMQSRRIRGLHHRLSTAPGCLSRCYTEHRPTNSQISHGSTDGSLDRRFS